MPMIEQKMLEDAKVTLMTSEDAHERAMAMVILSTAIKTKSCCQEWLIDLLSTHCLNDQELGKVADAAHYVEKYERLYGERM